MGDTATRGPSRGTTRAVTAVADQLLYSLTNFILTVLVARYSTPTSFGAYSILVATFLIASAVNRGLTSEPLIIRFSAATPQAWRGAVLGGMSLAFIFGLVAGMALAVISWLLPGPFGPLGSVFSVAMPLLFVQDFLRYAALAAGRPSVALVNDATVALVQIALSLVAIAAGHRSTLSFVVIWVVAGLAGGVVGGVVFGLRPRWAGWQAALAQRDLAFRLATDNFVTQLSQQGTGYVVGAASGLRAAAGLRAAQTVFTPPAILTVGVQSAMTPELVRMKAQSLTRMRRTLGRVALSLFVLGVLFEVAALSCPDSLGTALFGASWFEAKPLLVYLGLAQIGGGLANTAVTGLRALADARRTLRARSIGVAATACAVIPGALVDGARGASIALAAASAGQAAIWWWHFAESFKQSRAEATTRRIHTRWQRLLASADAPRTVTGHSRHGLTADRAQAAFGLDAFGVIDTGFEIGDARNDRP